MGDVDFSVSLKQTVKSEAEQAADAIDHLVKAWNAADKAGASGSKGFDASARALGDTATASGAAAKALGSTSKALGATEKAAKQAAKGLGSTVNAEIGWAAIAKKQSNTVQAEAARRSKAAKALAMDQARAAKQQADAIAKANKDAASRMDAAFGLVKRGAIAAGAAVAALGAAGGALAGKFAFETFKGADMASGIRGVYSILTKSAKGGEDALQDLFDLALKTSVPIDELNETYGSLMQAGFSKDQAKQFTEIEHNVRAISREPDVFRDKMRDAMKELKLSGKISDTIIEDLGEQLGGPEKMWDALSKAMGKSKDELVEMAKAGQFKDLDALFRAAGELGKGFEGASKAAKPWEQRLGSIKETFFTMLGAEVDFGAGDLFDKAEAWLASDEGKGKISEWADDIQWLIDKAEDAWPVVAAFGEGIGTAFDHIGAVLKALSGPLKTFFDTDDDMEAWTMLAYAAGYGLTMLAAGLGTLLTIPFQVAGGFVLLTQKVTSFWVETQNAFTGGASAVGGAFSSIYLSAVGTFTGLVGQAIGWGAQIPEAIASGIRSKADAAVGAIQAMANRIQAAFKGALDFRSPPHVFADMGAQISTAVGQGVEGDASAPEKSMGKLAGGMQATMENDLGMSSASGFFGGGAAAMGLGLTAPTTDLFAPPPAMTAPSPEMFAPMVGSGGDATTAGGGIGGATLNLTMNVSQQPGEDGESFAQRVVKLIRDEFEGQALAAGV